MNSNIYTSSKMIRHILLIEIILIYIILLALIIGFFIPVLRTYYLGTFYALAYMNAIIFFIISITRLRKIEKFVLISIIMNGIYIMIPLIWGTVGVALLGWSH